MTTETAMNNGMMGGMPHPDMDMEVYFTLHENGNSYIIHDKKFSDELGWVEYDVTTSKIDFVTEGGEIRNFGIPVDPQFGKHLHNLHKIMVVLMINGKAIEGEELPLILHQS